MSDGRFKTVLGYLGWLSYPLYCVHIPIYMLATILLGEGMIASGVAMLGCVDKRDSQISRGLIQGFFFGGGSLGLSERCERRCVGDH